MKKLPSHIVFISFLIAVLALSYACSKKTPAEEEVRRTIAGAVKKAEEKDVKGFMGFISKDYSDETGNSHDEIRGIVFFHFMRPEKLSVFVRSLEVRVEGATALVDAKVIAVRGGGGDGVKEIKDIIPEDAAGYRFSLVMKKEDGDWKVTTAEWKDIGAASLL